MTTGENKALHIALNSCSHPASLLSLAVLLFNDHVLRVCHPSWFTGKLGDVAWLVFFPFAAAALFSLVLPRRVLAHGRSVILLSLAFTALWYSLVKVFPFFNEMTGRLYRAVTGINYVLVSDPSDLLALPALGISWLIWRKNSTVGTEFRPGPVKVFIVALALFASVANAPMPDYGIEHVVEDNGALVALCRENTAYRSTDGGLTWQPWKKYTVNATNLRFHRGAWQFENVRKGILYSLQPGDGVYLSTDKGKTWKKKVDTGYGVVRDILVRNRRHDSTVRHQPVPGDAIIHRATGNLVVAMGHEGVLVHGSDNGWHHVPVGPYRRIEAGTFFELISILSMEILQGVLLFFIIVAMFSARAGIRKWLYVTLVIMTGLFWIAGALLSPALMSGYGVMLLAIIPLNAVILVPWGAYCACRLGMHSRKDLISALCAGFAGIVLYLVPHLMWVWGIIDHYNISLVNSLVVFVVAAVGSYFFKGSPSRG